MVEWTKTCFSWQKSACFIPHEWIESMLGTNLLDCHWLKSFFKISNGLISSSSTAWFKTITLGECRWCIVQGYYISICRLKNAFKAQSGEVIDVWVLFPYKTITRLLNNHNVGRHSHWKMIQRYIDFCWVAKSALNGIWINGVSPCVTIAPEEKSHV